MTEIKEDELKPMMLDIMKYVHNFCVENSINYSISAGTLIGAIRHKGFIPWDDDIDIMMSRPNYEKFLKLFANTEIQKNNNYKVISSYSDKNFFYPFAKVTNTKTRIKEDYNRIIPDLGVNIDVFVFDGLPPTLEGRDAYWKMIRKQRNLSTVIYQKKMKNEKFPKSLIRKVLYWLLRPFPANIFANRLHKLAMKNPYEGCEIIAKSTFGYDRKEEMPGNLFDEYIDVTFEGCTFKSVKNYDTYLRNLFGDYMQLPPEEERVSKHSMHAWWI